MPSSCRSVPSGRRGGAAASWKHIATCSRPPADHLPELLAGRLDRLDLDVRLLRAQAHDRLRDHGRERARERADAQRLALGVGQLGDLLAGLREPVGDRVGVGEQQRAGRGRRRPARAAFEQLHAELALERGDLLGDRRLGQRERLARARERALTRHFAERQHSPRIHIAAAYTAHEEFITLDE